MNKKTLILTAFTVVYLAYFLFNWLSVDGRIFKTALDESIPFVPIFVVPYLSFLLFIPTLTLLFFFKAPEKLFLSLTLSGITATLISYLIFSAFPTSGIKPEVANSDLFSQLVKLIYAHDLPHNLFPSGHTFNTVLFFLHFSKWKPRYTVISAITSGLIIASTVLIKQHYLPDVIGGLALGTVTTLTFWKILKI